MPNITLQKIIEEAGDKFNGVQLQMMTPLPEHDTSLIKQFISQSITKALTEVLREVRPEEHQPTEGYFDDVDNVRLNQGHNCCIQYFDNNVKKILGE